jgi:hypothetical protein
MKPSLLNSSLQLAIARELPGVFQVVEHSSDYKEVCWKFNSALGYCPAVKDTEWDYIMLRLIEPRMTADEELQYIDRLAGKIMDDVYEDSDIRYKNSHLSSDHSTYRATFNQRAAAYCEVKGINVG